jgi:drug/metabolite transporter (DMT)-like permease
VQRSVTDATSRRTPRAAVGFVLISAAAIWGFSFPLLKTALHHIGPIEFLTIRFAIATTALVVLWPRAAHEALRSGRKAGLIAGTLLALGHILQTVGLERTLSTHAAFITGLYVVFTPLFAAVILRRRPSAVVLFAVLVTVVGMALMSLNITSGALALNHGDLLVLGCAVAYAGQIVAVARYAPEMDPRVLLIQQLAVTTVLLALMLPTQPVVVPSGGAVWNALIVCALGSSAFGIGAQTWGQRLVSPTRAAVIFASEAPFAALFAYLLAHERLAGRAWVGIALVGTAIVIVAIRRPPAPHDA